MEISIEMLNDEDAKCLFTFECDNRSFFEQTVPSRGDDYYSFENFKVRHKELLNEQEVGLSYFYLIKDGSGTIVGRINLVDIDPIDCTADVGYRIGEAFTQKGIANEALKRLVNLAPGLNVVQIHAKTTSDNIASQKVLEKNGFERISTNGENNVVTGQKVTFYHYSRNL
ncbi:Putative ribosomal N-acetyltransferase YdaF [Peribacillus sp. Bi96]|uniref:GNAT family N-acetyltransferase n=1 Tax=Peribacillus sp. Bi96 TaxID=2884273 RepID=UPI001DCD45AA|nr:GNAT family protein [Peribacillus sp. Bi96]CAH0293632.1 Putative ribosomal N-acetyltransferase YdaF [Peribacillus sp. Bi96]